MKTVDRMRAFNNALLDDMLFNNDCPERIRDQLSAAALVRLFSLENSIGKSARLAAWVLGVSISTVYRRIAEYHDVKLEYSILAGPFNRAVRSEFRVEHHVNNMVAS
jgi:hypothetical protein